LLLLLFCCCCFVVVLLLLLLLLPIFYISSATITTSPRFKAPQAGISNYFASYVLSLLETNSATAKRERI
jgi:hypothetical protein